MFFLVFVLFLKTQIDTNNTSVQLQSPVEMLKRFNSLILK